MEQFIVKHQAKITGMISCFDRLLFNGYLPISHPEGMEVFLNRRDVLLKDFKSFASSCSQSLKLETMETARKAGRPFQYLNSPIRKEDTARAIAERDGIAEGLACIFSIVEACQSFKLKYGEGRPHLAASSPRGLCLYFYYLDREFGLMHIRLQIWFPFTVQVYLNGHDWLARKMMRHGIGHVQVDNAFVRIDDCRGAQGFADRFVTKYFPRILKALTRKVNPLLKGLLQGMHHYWVIDQAEFATDILFQDRAVLKDPYPQLLRRATVCFSAEDVFVAPRGLRLWCHLSERGIAGARVAEPARQSRLICAGARWAHACTPLPARDRSI